MVTTATTYDTPQTVNTDFSSPIDTVSPIFVDVTTVHFTDDHTYSASHTLSDDGKRAENGRLKAQQRESKSTTRRAFGETKSHSESATTTWDSTSRGFYETSTEEFLVYEEEGSYSDPSSGGKRVSNGKSQTNIRAHTETYAWNELISVEDTNKTEYDHLWQHHLLSEGTFYNKATHILTESYGPSGSTLELQVSWDSKETVSSYDRERGSWDDHENDDDDNKYDYSVRDDYRIERHEHDGQRRAFEEWRREITLETEIPDHVTVQHYSPPGVHYYIAPHDPLENEQAPPPAKKVTFGDSVPFTAPVLSSPYIKPAGDTLVEYRSPTGAFFRSIWDSVKIWDNNDVAENYDNLRDEGRGKASSTAIAVIGAVGERSGAAGIANGLSGRNRAGDQLTPGERIWEGTTGLGETAIDAVGLKAIGTGIKQGTKRAAEYLRAGFDDIRRLWDAKPGGGRIKGDGPDGGPHSAPKADEPAGVAHDAAKKMPEAPGIAPDNFRGRFNADRHAHGLARLPDDYDAHHTIPQRYLDHPEFKDFDFHDPSNIRGVKGSRADENIHQQITNRWEDFARRNPNATRSQIEAFRDQIAIEFTEHWFQ